jgi:hypothetical protein
MLYVFYIENELERIMVMKRMRFGRKTRFAKRMVL